MSGFAIRFPLCSAHCSSVVVGLNSEQQVRAMVELVEGVRPRQDLVDRAYAMWRDDYRS